MPTVFTNPAIVPAISVESLAISNVVGLEAALAGKAAASHTHPQSEVTNLVTDLTAKAAAADVTALTAVVAGKAAASHTHPQSEVTNLVTDLAGKAAAVHTHTQSQVTGLLDALAALMPAAIHRTTAQGRPLDDAEGTSLAISGAIDPDITSHILQKVGSESAWTSNGSAIPATTGLWAALGGPGMLIPLGTWVIYIYQDGVYTGKSFISYSAATPQAATWGYATTGGATGVPTVSLAESGGTPAGKLGRLCIVGEDEFWQCIRLTPVLWKRIAQAEDVMHL